MSKYEIKNIYVNQIGYLPASKKIAYVDCSDTTLENKSFSIVDCNSQKEVFSGSLIEMPEDELCGKKILSADFSSFCEKGKFTVRAGNFESYSFEICDYIFDDLFYSTLKYFNLSRCGQNVCHTGMAVVYGTDRFKDVQGGWHDAGDYGRYVVAGTKAVMDLLFAYEVSEKIPDLKKPFPIMDEVRFELEWLLQMQREDGAVYHKISCYNFCGFINPKDEKEQLVLAPVSTAATADFAGCLAYASSFFKDSDSEFAEKLLSAAILAQKYLDKHKDEIFRNPPEITTGGYGDPYVMDERYFALCSLYAVTKTSDYLNKAIKIYNKEKFAQGFGWGFVGGYGSKILLKVEKDIKSICNKKFVEKIKSKIISEADAILKTSEKSSFGVCIDKILWGSNGAVCDFAHVCYMAYRLTNERKYLEVCKKQLDYILGCNPLNYCYVTNFGTNYPMNPHHRPSKASGSLVSGMLVGGPAAGLQDECAKKHLVGKKPLLCYIDKLPSFSTNEVAIYWNSAFVCLLSNFLR